jgi:hypothetical protein
MKTIIKIIIALAFILITYFIGSHQSNVSCKEKLNAFNVQMLVYENSLLEMKDSLAFLRKQLYECSMKRMDTLKVQYIDNSMFIPGKLVLRHF